MGGYNLTAIAFAISLMRNEVIALAGSGELTSKVSVRGQTAIPQRLREALGIRAGTRLSWSVCRGALIASVSTGDPVKSSRGMLKGRTRGTKALLEQRALERTRERETRGIGGSDR